MAAKRGRPSAEELAFLRKNARKGPAEIARLLNRTVEAVTAWMEQHVRPEDLAGGSPARERAALEKVAVRQELRASKAWRQLQDQFSPGEIEHFEEEYVALCQQFKEDVLATENTQIMLAIKYQILMDRNLAAKKAAGQDLRRLIRMRDGWIEKRGEDASAYDETDRTFLLDLESQINAAKAADQSKTKEFNDLETRHQALIRDLKATREQRFNRVESSKETYVGLLKRLAQEEEREAEGRQAELMKRATNREMERLGGLHEYEDGKLDQPILCAETVEMLDRKEMEREEQATGDVPAAQPPAQRDGR